MNKIESCLQKLAGAVILLRVWQRLAIGFFLGVLASFGQVPYDFIPACFVSFTLLIWLMDGVVAGQSKNKIASLLSAACVGWFFGFGYFLSSGGWSGSAIFFDPSAKNLILLRIIDSIIFSAFSALFFGCATGISRFFWSNGIGRIFSIAVAFSVMESLREYFFPEFFWNPISFAIMPFSVLMHSIRIMGIAGMTMIAVLIFSMPALLAFYLQRKIGVLTFCFFMILHVGFGFFSFSIFLPQKNYQSFIVRLMQPNIGSEFEKPENNKDDGRLIETLLNLSSKTAKNKKPDLLIVPEFFFLETPEEEQKRAFLDLGKRFSDEAYMILARFIREEGSNRYNSVALIKSKEGVFDFTDKISLEAFYDYMPLNLGIFQFFSSWIHIKKAFPEFRDLSAGHQRKVLNLSKGFKALVYMDHERISTRDRELFSEGNLFIVHIKKDRFSNHFSAVQELREARIKAVEARKFIILSTGFGISAAITPQGQVIYFTKTGTQNIKDIDIGIWRPNSLINAWNEGGFSKYFSYFFEFFYN